MMTELDVTLAGLVRPAKRLRYTTTPHIRYHPSSVKKFSLVLDVMFDCVVEGSNESSPYVNHYKANLVVESPRRFVSIYS